MAENWQERNTYTERGENEREESNAKGKSDVGWFWRRGQE